MKTFRRSAALFLSFIMLCQLLSVSAFAGGTAEYRAPSAVYSVTFGEDTYLITGGYTISELPEPPAEEGKAFLGWFDGDTKVEAPYTPTGDVRLTAKYEEIAEDLDQRTLVESLDSGAVVSLTGAIPEGLKLNVDEPVETVRFRARSAGGMSVPMALYTYALSLKNADGTDYELVDGPITVTVRGQKFVDALAAGRSIRLTEGTGEEITDLQVSGDTVTFTISRLSSFRFTGIYDLVEWESALSTAAVDISLYGTMPNGAKAEVVPVSPVVADATILAAADITLLNSGVDVEPSSWGSELMVTMTNEAIAGARSEGKELHVVHIADDGTQTQLNDALLSFTDNSVTFPASQFSVYAVVEDEHPDARMTIRFWGKDTNEPIATVFVKNSDQADQIAKIIYDPGVGDMADQETFRGWLIGERNSDTLPEYTVANATNNTLKTIEGIRDWAVALDDIEEGDEIDIVAAIYRIYVVTYLDPDGIAQNADSILVMPNDTNPYRYTISQSYNPTLPTKRFDGWQPTENTAGNFEVVQMADLTGEYYNKDDIIIITGNVDFEAKTSDGHWIIYHENGKGAYYKAPDFVEFGHNTVEPDRSKMTRNGYNFVNWYKQVTGEPDANNYQHVVADTKFTFDQPINEADLGEDQKLHLYAEWETKTKAPYTVICWSQNADRTAYELASSYVGNGDVGDPIPFTFVNNGDEDYVMGVGSDNNGAYGHIKGFTLKHDQQNILGNLLDASGSVITVPTVAAEGDSVLNLYFDRIEYDLKFYMYRSSGNNYEYATRSNAGRNVWGIATGWTNVGSNNLPRTTYPGFTNLLSENTDNYTGYYFTLHAYYGEDISSKWPTYDQLKGPNNDGTKAVSFVMMNGTRLKGNSYTGNGYGDGRDTIKGQITVMDDGILALTNDADGNYLIIRYASYNDWTYHIYYECIPGVTYENKVSKTINGVTKEYYFDHDVQSRSSNTYPGQQNPPAYQGFEVATTDGTNEYYDGYGGNAPRQDNITGYTVHLNYYYNRQLFTISYMDGSYFNGNGGIDHSRGSEMLKDTVTFDSGDKITQGVSDQIMLGQAIPDDYKTWEPNPPAGENGYIFCGWYIDEACTTPYTFDKMTMGGIIVHAKWQQIEYRIFLKPNLPEGVTDVQAWGSAQTLSFRKAYNDTVSLPDGHLENYEFAGWFTTPDFQGNSMFIEDYHLTEELEALQDYNKTTDLTDPMDMYGNVPATGYNSDVQDGNGNPRDRWWITRKLVLYAKWREILPGAPGISVVYTEGELGEPGSAPTDSTYYSDKAKATAQAGCSALNDEEYAFECWIVQQWNGSEFEDTSIKVYPGDTFEVLKSYAHEEDIPEEEQTTPGITKKYTFQLRAEYYVLTPPTPTHIWWFPNYPDSNTEDNIPEKENQIVTDYNPPTSIETKDGYQMGINQGVMIKPGNTFTAPAGYTFLGWARVDSTRTDSSTNTNNAGNVLPLGYDDVYLLYHAAADGNAEYYTLKENSDYNGRTVDRVAADEQGLYHDMYAVWEADTKVPVQKIWLPNTGVVPIPESVTVELLHDGQSDSPALTYELKASEDWTCTFENLPTRNNNSELIEYSVKEYPVPSGWTESYGSTSVTAKPGDKTATLTVTNTRDTGTLVVKKENIDTNNLSISGLSNKEYKVTIQNSAGKYLQSDTNFSFADEPAVEFTIKENDDPSKSFNLPTDTYTVTEVNTDSINYNGYKFVSNSYTVVVDGGTPTSSTNNASGGVQKGKTTTVTIKNTFIQTVKVKVSKKFVIDDSAFALPTDFQISYDYTIGGRTVSGVLDHTTVQGPYQDKIYEWPTIEVPIGVGLTLTESGFNLNNYSVKTDAEPRNQCTPYENIDGVDTKTTVYAMPTSYSSSTKVVTFINTYTRTTVPVTLKKMVNGNLANFSEEFSFMVQLVEADGTTPMEITNLTDENGFIYTESNPLKLTPSLNADPGTSLGNLPIGAKLIITELGATNYHTDYLVDGSSFENSFTIPDNTDNKTVTVTIASNASADQNPNMAIVFGNYANMTIPTGISLDFLPYLVLLGLVLIGLAAVVVRRRKENG